MVSARYGKRIDLNTLRREHPVSAHGATLAEILAIADKLELGARALRLELEDMRALQLPAILHWDMTHFVVLTHVGKSPSRFTILRWGNDNTRLTKLAGTLLALPSS